MMIPMQRHGNDDRLEDQRDRRGDVKMRRVLDIGLPRHRQGEHDGLQREDIEEREKAILIEQHEARQHESACKKMSDVEFDMAHL